MLEASGIMEIPSLEIPPDLRNRIIEKGMVAALMQSIFARQILCYLESFNFKVQRNEGRQIWDIIIHCEHLRQIKELRKNWKNLQGRKWSNNRGICNLCL